MLLDAKSTKRRRLRDRSAEQVLSPLSSEVDWSSTLEADSLANNLDHIPLASILFTVWMIKSFLLSPAFSICLAVCHADSFLSDSMSGCLDVSFIDFFCSEKFDDNAIIISNNDYAI